MELVVAWIISTTAIALMMLVTWGFVLAGGDGGVQLGGFTLYGLSAVLVFSLQWIGFIQSWLQRSERLFDLMGSITVIVVTVTAIVLAGRFDIRSLMLALVILVWAGRLGPFLYLRIRKAGEDRRFRHIKRSFPTLLMTWTLQGLWVFVSLSCALAAITASVSIDLGPSFFVGLGLWIVGFALEVIADTQKTRFRAQPENQRRFITSGLWAWSRHPNYFGEIVLWCGVAVMAYPALVGMQVYTLVAPLLIVLLLTAISGARLLEARAERQWGEDPVYQAYKRSTPLLMLWPPRR